MKKRPLNEALEKAGLSEYAIKSGSSSDVNWTNHRYKHFPDKNSPWTQTVKSTKNGSAKYSLDINDIEAFEREAWNTGTKVTNGKKLESQSL